MSKQVYSWKRFWCPREYRINLSDSNYLYDPESESGIYNPYVVPFESITHILCLILLGEPGIGKTYVMKTEYKTIEKKVKKEGGQTLWLDLRAYRSEDRLIRNLFESKPFDAWVNGEHQLHLFLDSLDECLLRIDTLSALLIDELKKHPIKRLYLRIACRTAEWPKSLEDGLKKLWDNNMKVYTLAPLREVDVIEAAKTNGLNPEKFLREINQKEVGPLASKPVTLNLLINIYSRNSQLPSTQADLYRQGCHLLCEETSQSRRDAGLTGTFTAEQRLAMAARIAAITVFTNKFGIWTGLDQGDVPDEDITIQELCGGKESTGDNQFHVSETALKETLATGLFLSLGPNRMSWAHQTYAEYLAAHYLVRHEMTLTQMMSLIVHAGNPEGKIVPQLHEPAAWLAGMVPDIFREIMKVDPEVLLQSDVATVDIKNQGALVETLLRSYDEETLLDTNRDNRLNYRKLFHPGLAEQLRPYICDSTKGIVVRRVAIDIAEACELQTLQSELADIALDPCQPLDIRVNAAYAVNYIGDDITKAKLKPLVVGESGDDPDDELIGCGLQAVWPNHMAAEELFAILTPPKRPTFGGAYQRFLLSDVVQSLTVSDLPTALKWAGEQGSIDELPYAFEKLIDNIMLKAWEHLESPGVLEAFARGLLPYLKHYKYITTIENALTKDNNKRRQVLVEIMSLLLSDLEEDSLWFAYFSTSFNMSTDMQWMIERLHNEKSKEAQTLWAQLIGEAFDWREPGHFDAIYYASQDNPILADAFAWLLESVRLDSPEAQKMKDNYSRRQELLKRHTDRPLLEPPPKERVATLLDECETGDIAAWWRLNMEMMLEPDSTRYGDEGESDLTVLSGWKTADVITRARVIEAAKRYILEQDSETHKWLGADTLYRPAYAGYRALRLLLKEDPNFLSTITLNIWKKWAPIILAFLTSGNNEEELQCDLVKFAYEHAPEEIINTLMILIDQENEEHNSISITRKVKHCWDDRLANALLTKARDEKLKPECMSCLLGDLLDHRISEAKAFAESLISLSSSSALEERSRVIVAARILMTHAEDAGWSVVWPAIMKDDDFGQEIISMVAQHEMMEAMVRRSLYDTSIGQRLTVGQLADLYVWVARQYPHDQDPQHEGGLGMDPREYVANWRDSILHHLVMCGTDQACEAIQCIARELPELNWLKWTLARAQNITRSRTWTPPQPSDILKLADNQQMHLVQSGHQLLDVLIESLKRIENKLQGEIPDAQFLWNETSKNTYKPKDENSFSDYIKNRLDEDLKQRGIIVNREVQIHRGQRTDMHIDAVIQDSHNRVYDSVTVIIEVKGCWNPDLDHAMETQLMDQYLRDNHCQHGLYLVGWFNCDRWDNKDYRKCQAPKFGKDEAQNRFNDQSAELSQGGTQIKAFVINTALSK